MKEIERHSTLPNEEEIVSIFAVLDDLTGKKYYLKTAHEQYVWLSSDLQDCQIVTEEEAYTATIKHNYKIATDSISFPFKNRQKLLGPSV